MEAISAIKLADVYAEIRKFDVIGVDEGQFVGCFHFHVFVCCIFQFEDVETFSQALANLGKVVIIAALNGDYRQKPFQCVTTLFAMAERIDKLSAVCRRCGHSASFTFRTCQSSQVI